MFKRCKFPSPDNVYHSIDQSINQSINQKKIVCTPTDVSAVMFTRRCLSCALYGNDNMDWSGHCSTMSFQVLRSVHMRCLPFTEHCSMIFGSVSWRQTWSNHDNLRRLIKLLLTGFHRHVKRRLGHLCHRWSSVVHFKVNPQIGGHLQG